MHGKTAGMRAKRRSKASDVTWRETAEGRVKYAAKLMEAQKRADETGIDHGLEPNDLFEDFSVMMLPRPQFRFGFELRVEVVHPGTPLRSKT